MSLRKGSADKSFFRKSSAPQDQRWSLKSLVSRMKKKKNSDLDDFMVIGIDFGTTYSGAAWATIADFENNEINLITNWPDARGEEGKAPTELFYEDNNVSWGYGIPHDADPLRWFKLLLLRDEDLAEEIRGSEFLIRGRRMLKEENKTATDLVADYLKALWRHTLDTMLKARSKSVIEALAFRVVITVPAIWKDYARKEMEEAARKAGILGDRSAGPTTLTFAPEPEAAALATLYERGKDINTDDVYVICDAGGGTVDLISYRVGKLDPIELHEAVLGTGGLCGGIFVDEAFQTICKNRLGRQWNKLSQTGIKEIMHNEWERAIKTTFVPGDTRKEYIVAIPAEAVNDSNRNDDSRKPVIRNGRIHFVSSDIQKAFTSVFTGIGNLVDGQISQAKASKMQVKAVILVGGLGSSPYLYQYLEDRYKSKKIEVLQAGGMKPRTAICRGAIFKGFLDERVSGQVGSELPVSVVSTIARQSLGVEYQTQFEQGIHLEKDKFWDDIQGCWKARHQMEWYLKKGENVLTKAPVKRGFFMSYASEEDFDSALHEEILQCDNDDPPETRTDAMKELCSIDCSIDHIKFDSLPSYAAPNGKMVKRLNFEIEMVPSGASNIFAVYYEEKQLGQQQASINFQ